MEHPKILAFEAGSLCLVLFRDRSEKQSSDQDQRDWDMGWQKI